MEIIGSTVLILLLLTCTFLVREYAQKEVPFRVKLLTVLSWLFCFSAYTLLPFDIYYVENSNE